MKFFLDESTDFPIAQRLRVDIQYPSPTLD
jgi:hypothetical protein